MTPNVTLAILAGVLFGTGVVLLLSRSLVRSLLGVTLMGNGVNVIFLLASGAPGRAAIVSKDEAGRIVIGPQGISDPLPQAMVLTAIVITLAVTGFVLSLAHRQWQLAATDDLDDDPEDTRISRLAESNDLSGSDYTDTSDPHALADDADEAVPPSQPSDAGDLAHPDHPENPESDVDTTDDGADHADDVDDCDDPELIEGTLRADARRRRAATRRTDVPEEGGPR